MPKNHDGILVRTALNLTPALLQVPFAQNNVMQSGMFGMACPATLNTQQTGMTPDRKEKWLQNKYSNPQKDREK